MDATVLKSRVANSDISYIRLWPGGEAAKRDRCWYVKSYASPGRRMGSEAEQEVCQRKKTVGITGVSDSSKDYYKGLPSHIVGKRASISGEKGKTLYY